MPAVGFGGRRLGEGGVETARGEGKLLLQRLHRCRAAAAQHGEGVAVQRQIAEATPVSGQGQQQPVGQGEGAGGRQAEPAALPCQQFGEGQRLRADQVEGTACRCIGRQATQHHLHQVVDVYRLQRLSAVAGKRHDRQGRQGPKQRHAFCAGAIDDGGAQDQPVEVEGLQQRVGGALAAVVGALCALVGAQGRDLDDPPHAALGGGTEQGAGCVAVQRGEGLATGLTDDADGVDHRLDPGEARQPWGDVAVAAEVALDIGWPGQAAGGGRHVADAGDDLVTLRQQGAQQVAADEAAGAGEQDLHRSTPRCERTSGCSGGSPGPPPAVPRTGR